MELKKISKSVFVQQVGTTTISQIATLMLSLVTAAITARWLGPAGKGELAMIFMVPALFQLFLSAGLGPANVYYVGSHRVPVKNLAENSVFFSIIGALIGFIVIILLFQSGLLSSLLPGITPMYLILGMLALPLGLLNGNLTSILQGLRRISTLNILTVVSSILNVALMAVLLILLDYGIVGAILVSLFSQTFILGLVAYYTKKEGGIFWPRWDIKIARPTLGFGIRSYIGNLLQFFNYRLDLFIVNFFLGPAEVGIYGVAVVIAELLWKLPNATSFVIFPKSANSTQKEMNRFTPRVFWIVLGISCIGAIGLATFGKSFILIVFSYSFLDAFTPLLILLPGVVLLGAGKILTNDIAGRGFPQYNSITSGISLVATVLFDLIFIPKYGVVGAALASTLSYTLTFILAVIFYRSVAKRFAY
jgi:O-antigen/teichoic acid export membrane protein